LEKTLSNIYQLQVDYVDTVIEYTGILALALRTKTLQGVPLWTLVEDLMVGIVTL
jgi:hypothetical protein